MRRALMMIVIATGLGVLLVGSWFYDTTEGGDAVGGLTDEPSTPSADDDVLPLPPPPPGEPIHRDTGTPRDEGETPEWM